MIKSYVAKSEKVSLEQVIDKAWSLAQCGCQVLSIEHKMMQYTESGPDGWEEQRYGSAWEIVVDDEGKRSERLPEIRENTRLPVSELT